MIFEDAAQIEIQGEEVLEFLFRYGDFALYRVIGFENPKIEIRDYRKSGLQAIDDVLERQDRGNFPHVFSSAAHVKIKYVSPDKISVELFDTDEQEISYVVWIVVGITEPIPYCDYLFYKLEELNKEKFAFISVFDSLDGKYKFRTSDQVVLWES